VTLLALLVPLLGLVAVAATPPPADPADLAGPADPGLDAGLGDAAAVTTGTLRPARRLVARGSGR
jgi:hypothetical protein